MSPRATGRTLAIALLSTMNILLSPIQYQYMSTRGVLLEDVQCIIHKLNLAVARQFKSLLVLRASLALANRSPESPGIHYIQLAPAHITLCRATLPSCAHIVPMFTHGIAPGRPRRRARPPPGPGRADRATSSVSSGGPTRLATLLSVATRYLGTVLGAAMVQEAPLKIYARGVVSYFLNSARAQAN